MIRRLIFALCLLAFALFAPAAAPDLAASEDCGPDFCSQEALAACRASCPPPFGVLICREATCRTLCRCT